ncbi:unnamed protein product, partial [Adineta steineri]
MSNLPLYSSIVEKHNLDRERIIPKWLDCPEKSTIIYGKFVAFKMPIEDQNTGIIPEGKKWSWNMLIQNIKDDKQELGLVIDLSLTKPYYTTKDEKFIQETILYKKIPCEGHDETPKDSQIQQFIDICRGFINSNPNDIIGVHSTYGFNRAGYFICAYLCQQLKISIDKAIDLFAVARSPGVFSQNYLDKLIQEYGNENNESKLAPPLSPWCLIGLTESTTNKRLHDDTDSEEDKKRTRHEIYTKSVPKFAVDLVNVIPIESKSALHRIRSKFQQMCKYDQQTFPGSRPVSMDFKNYTNILNWPYKVSWSPDGIRYMMLILNESEIYMIDRNNDVFQINKLWFPEDSEYRHHLEHTLLDGVFVVDKMKDKEKYRYYVYDIVYYNNENIYQQPFTKRMAKYQEIIEVRNGTVSKGLMNDCFKPFSVRAKDFWDLSAGLELLGDKFQSQLRHESNGLIFQPVNEPYIFGLAWRVLKWKKYHTIDFQLKITNEGQSQVKIAHLYLNNMEEPFRSMAYSSELDHYNNKII